MIRFTPLAQTILSFFPSPAMAPATTVWLLTTPALTILQPPRSQWAILHTASSAHRQRPCSASLIAVSVEERLLVFWKIARWFVTLGHHLRILPGRAAFS